MEVRPGYKQTEIGVIPEEWGVDALGKSCDVVTKGTTPTSIGRAFTKSGVAFLKAESISESGNTIPEKVAYIDTITHTLLKRSQLKRNDVLISIAGVLGRVGFVEDSNLPANTNQALAIVRLGKKSQFERSFLFYALRSPGLSRQIRDINVQAAQANISLQDVRDFLLPTPPTLEQRAIATALSDVDALLDGLDLLIAKKRDLKQAAMQQLLTGETRLPGFDGEWEAVAFGDIASIRNAKVIPASTPAGTQCVELEAIDQGTGRLLMSDDATGLSSKYVFRRGDVLFGRLRAYLRKYWLATFDGVCSTEIWPLVARDERLSGGFLHLLVQTNDFVNAAGVSYGTHMPRSDWSVLKELPVRLPRVPEQTAIAGVLSDMDDELAALEARYDKTRDLKQAMMQELFTGKTRLVHSEAINV